MVIKRETNVHLWAQGRHRERERERAIHTHTHLACPTPFLSCCIKSGSERNNNNTQKGRESTKSQCEFWFVCLAVRPPSVAPSACLSVPRASVSPCLISLAAHLLLPPPPLLPLGATGRGPESWRRAQRSRLSLSAESAVCVLRSSPLLPRRAHLLGKWAPKRTHIQQPVAARG